jgi:hypothetical protein
MFKTLRVVGVNTLFLVSAAALAQNVPGDDYVTTCTNSPTFETVNLYGGFSQCQVQFVQNGILYTTPITEIVAPSTASTRFIYNFTFAGLLGCWANVPFLQTVTRQTGTQQQCTSVPRQPFTQLEPQDTGCVGGATTYRLNWPAQTGDGYVLEVKDYEGQQWRTYWGGTIPGASIDVWGLGPKVVVRLRTMRDGTSGSWSYATLGGRCSNDISE